MKELAEHQWLWGPGYLQPWRVAAQTHDGTRAAASGQGDAAAYMRLILLFNDSQPSPGILVHLPSDPLCAITLLFCSTVFFFVCLFVYVRFLMRLLSPTQKSLFTCGYLSNYCVLGQGTKVGISYFAITLLCNCFLKYI